MLFGQHVSEIKTTAIVAATAQPAASPEVLSRLRVGRHTITITATADGVYVGGSDVTSSNGMPVANNSSITIPVDSDEPAAVYVIGNVILTEYF